LRAAASGTGSPLLVELKSGDTYNGRLVSCDAWMNLNLRDVICTSRDGDRFWKLPTCYIRGSAVKYLRLPPDVLNDATALSAAEAEANRSHSSSGTTTYHRGGGGRAGRGGGGRQPGGRGNFPGRGRDGRGNRGQENGRGNRGQDSGRGGNRSRGRGSSTVGRS
jgi:U6 snRNA-associated Sm-like protein LSm4